MIHLHDDPVILRPLAREDASALAQLANNKKIWDNVRDLLPHPYSESNAVAFITSVADEVPQRTFAITFENELAGVIGLVPQTDVYRKTAEIGYWLGEPFWNRGIATKAVRLLTVYGLYELHFMRLHAGVFEYNKASMAVLQKCGYRMEGIFEKAIYKNNQFWNEHRYAIVR